MLRGDKIGLRARQETDIPVLHEHLYDDVATRARADPRPWRPIARDSKASPFRTEADDAAFFSRQGLRDGACDFACVRVA